MGSNLPLSIKQTQVVVYVTKMYHILTSMNTRTLKQECLEKKVNVSSDSLKKSHYYNVLNYHPKLKFSTIF